MDQYNDLININEDWYSDKANREKHWDSKDTIMVGTGIATDMITDKDADPISSAIGAYIGTWIGKGIIYAVYKGKSKARGKKRERTFYKDSVTKDYTNTIMGFMKSPIKGASDIKKERINGGIQIIFKGDNTYSYYMTYDNAIKQYRLDIGTKKSGTIIGTLTIEKESDARTTIKKYIAPYVIEEDLTEYFEKGYGYYLAISDCKDNGFLKELVDSSDSSLKVRVAKESAYCYNELF